MKVCLSKMPKTTKKDFDNKESDIFLRTEFITKLVQNLKTEKHFQELFFLHNYSFINIDQSCLSFG